jgi:hypothetical protein
MHALLTRCRRSNLTQFVLAVTEALQPFVVA